MYTSQKLQDKISFKIACYQRKVQAFTKILDKSLPSSLAKRSGSMDKHFFVTKNGEKMRRFIKPGF